jgi:hypothetical protein
MAVERDERSSVAKEFIYGRGAGRTLIGSKGFIYGRGAGRTLIGSKGVYIWHDLFRANENESKTGLVRLLGVKQTKNKN